MEGSLLAILSIGFILGIKHAVEPDHVIAVSTIASRSKKLWRSSLAGVYWGVGHTAILFVFGMSFIILKNEISPTWALSLEFAVGLMLVYLGIASMANPGGGIMSYRRHKHHGSDNLHLYDGNDHAHKNLSYIQSLIIGMIHGLAGSAAFVLLTMSAASNAWHGVAFIIVFGIGTVAGMLLFTTIIGLPFVFSVKRVKLNRLLIRLAGLVSASFGFYYMYNLGVSEGLFKLWVQ
jgi:sulfite exporter TauE/SafE